MSFQYPGAQQAVVPDRISSLRKVETDLLKGMTGRQTMRLERRGCFTQIVQGGPKSNQPARICWVKVEPGGYFLSSAFG
jgi:hypothetical protein